VGNDIIKSDGWEDPKLLDSITKDLEAFNAEDEEKTPELEPTPVKDGDAPAADDKPTPDVEDKPKEEPKAGDTTADEKDATPANDDEEPAGTKEPERPAIPDGHYRAAIHMGMTPEEVSDLYDKDPKLALKTFAKCHEMTNAASKQLGELGQAMRIARETPVASAPTAVPAGESRRDKAIKAIKEKYADDPMVDVLIELLPPETPQTAPAKALTPAAPPERSIDEEIAVRQQISTFFADPDLEAYEDFYGSAKGPDGSAVATWDHLTPGQKANRLEMLGRAQLILDGAAATGMKLSTAEAMERAHLEVSAPIASQIVREKIKASVQKRSAGVTLKPSGGKNPPAKGGKYDEKEHIKEVANELKAVFGPK
jgi:hypothetical protein